MFGFGFGFWFGFEFRIRVCLGLGLGLSLRLRLGIVFWLEVWFISGIGLRFGLYYGSLVIFDICNLQTS